MTRRISCEESILSKRAFSTLRIFPFRGRIACVRRSRPCLAEPPAESPSTMKISLSASHTYAPFIFALSIMAIIYTSFVALAQEDVKKLIAYSSVAHMGFVTMGIFTLTHQGIEGGIYQMLSHGVVSGALFLCVGVIYDRMHTREIAAYGGLVARMPIYAACFMVFTLANVGLPGTGGFVGEFLTMLGAFRVNTWVAILSATGAILSAAYMLYLYWRVIFGKLVKPSLMAIQDLSLREFAILAPLVIITILMGVYPKPIFDVTHASVANLVAESRSPETVSVVTRPPKGPAKLAHSSPTPEQTELVQNMEHSVGGARFEADEIKVKVDRIEMLELEPIPSGNMGQTTKSDLYRHLVHALSQSSHLGEVFIQPNIPLSESEPSWAGRVMKRAFGVFGLLAPVYEGFFVWRAATEDRAKPLSPPFQPRTTSKRHTAPHVSGTAQ